ncbi:MAG TPA: D-alanyl-D-alanine carboxypeptidase family protein [Cellulomonas sp.]|uniref:M15 family metallopeptidase n=1 Tax=Cellulomonas sp. TaxID=40001 RepID=UPI002E31F53A|nr:D-alanyl-D-alanine carboxypeptidase family protein [Cellulomonas sp.]HEX5332780.1 D-alanyl-D-alanine carboxypeptidase family protein [Cellulomonas sp.]
MVSAGSFAMAGPSDITQSPLMADVAGIRTERAAAAAAAEQVSTDHREAVLAAAAAAAEQAQAVRSASATVVPAETLTQLDQATAELDQLLAAAGSPVEPVATAAPAPTEAAPTDAAPTDAATTSPTPTGTQTPSPAATGTATVAPTAQPTAGAAEPSPAGSAATDPTAVPSAAPTSPLDLSAPSTPTDTTSSSAAALNALADVPAHVEDAATTTLRTTAAKVAALTAEVTQAVRDQQAAADAAAAAEVEAARVAAEDAATRSAQRVSLDQYANGRIPASALCELTFAPGAELRCDAAAAIEQLNVAYREKFGSDLVISDSYRSYSSQVACRRTKGSLCAVPGTSNHGLGKAVDLGGGAQSFGTTQHNWLVANAATYGWTWPAWAHLGASKPEPWHWEYVD